MSKKGSSSDDEESEEESDEDNEMDEEEAAHQARIQLRFRRRPINTSGVRSVDYWILAICQCWQNCQSSGFPCFSSTKQGVLSVS